MTAFTFKPAVVKATERRCPNCRTWNTGTTCPDCGNKPRTNAALVTGAKNNALYRQAEQALRT